MAAVGNSGGGGNGSREIEAGRAFVSIGVKDNLPKGLERASRNVAKFAKETREKTQKSLLDETSLSKIGPTAVGLYAGKELATSLRDALVGASSYTRIFDSIAESTAKAAESAAKITEEFGRAAAFERGGSLASLRDKEVGELNKKLEEQLKNEARLLGIQTKLDRGTGALVREGRFGEAATRFFRTVGSGIGASESTDDIRKQNKESLAEVTAGIKDLQAKIRAAADDAARIRNPFSSPEFVNRIRDFRQELSDATNESLGLMGQYEKTAFLIQRENKDANAESQRRLALLREEAKRIDEVVKATEERKRKEDELKANAQRIQDDFTSELRNATLGLQTRGLSGEDARLAGLVTRGFSNDQIMRLRAIDLQTRTAAVTATAGQNIYSQFGGTGLESNRSAFGGERKELKQEVELTNTKLEEIRQALAAISTDFK